MEGPNMEPQNVCFSIIKKCLAAQWEWLLATVVWLWKADQTETHVLVPQQPAAQKSSLIIMILQRCDCILLLNGLAQNALSLKTILLYQREGLNLSAVKLLHSFYGLCLAFLCCDSKLSPRQPFLHYASVYLRHHSSLLFSIFNLPLPVCCRVCFCWGRCKLCCCVLPSCVGAGALRVSSLR